MPQRLRNLPSYSIKHDGQLVDHQGKHLKIMNCPKLLPQNTVNFGPADHRFLTLPSFAEGVALCSCATRV